MLMVIDPDPLITLPTPAVVRVALPNVTLLLPLTRSAWGPELRTRLLAMLPPLPAAVMLPPKTLRLPPLATPLAPTGPLVMAVAVTTLLLPRIGVPESRWVLPV